MPDAAVTTPALGRRFVEALGAKEVEALSAVIHPEVDFRALTPNRFWEAQNRDAMLDILLGSWFPADTALDELLLLEADTVADRERLRFRFRGRNRDGPMIVEQQAYLARRDDSIGWIRIVCSGQRAPT
jgi:hypothetical protein